MNLNDPTQDHKKPPGPIDSDLGDFATGTRPAAPPSKRPPTATRKQRGWAGCVAFGCVSMVVVGVVGMITAGFLLRALYREALAYSEEQPQPLPRVEPLPEPLVRALKSDYETFKRQLKSSQPPSRPTQPKPPPQPSSPLTEPPTAAAPPDDPVQADLSPPAPEESAPFELRLNADQINALIQEHPDFRELRDRIVVFIEDDRLGCQFSVPISWVGIRLEEERYLNGEARIAVALRDGRLKLEVKEVRIKGRPLSPSLLNRLQRLDFNAQIETHSEGKRTLRSLDSIEVRDGTVILRLKPPSN